MAIDVLRFADLNCRYAAIQVWSANQESEMAIPRLAYKVWLCGECDSHTEDKDNGTITRGIPFRMTTRIPSCCLSTGVSASRLMFRSGCLAGYDNILGW